MKITASLALLLAAATLLASLAGTARAETSALEQAATKEGQVTWYTSQIDSDTAHVAAEEFSRLHPGIAVNVIRTTTQVAYQRVNQELAHQAVQCDVFSTADVGQYVRMAEKKEFAKYTPPNATKLSPLFQNYDPQGYYYPTQSGEMVIAYNTQKVRAADAPKGWRDLLDPKWKDKITAGSPAYGAYAGNWVILMSKMYGWKYLQDFRKNNPLVTRSGIDTVNFLNSGESWVGVSPTASVLQSADKGNPVQIVYPNDGAVLMIVPSAVMDKAPHPNAARLFLDFMLSKEYGDILVKARNEPLRPDVHPLPGAKAVTEIATIKLSNDEVTVGIPKIIKQWRDLFGD
ncbi:MAG TPA: extracellular solute-binding protein [Stellaceae bacterium]|nr:extracellular solute-binding protein [Stellaceae bacterium]